jgi:hypothetical protein
LHSLFAGVIVVALLAAPDAWRADCGNLADRHTAAVNRVLDAAQRYEKCVSSSAQRDDCAAEMQALDNAHDNFSDAVADAKSCQ